MPLLKQPDTRAAALPSAQQGKETGYLSARLQIRQQRESIF